MATIPNYWMEQAEKSAMFLIDTVEKSSGVCESCGNDSPVTYYMGVAFECGKCFTDSVKYWEDRGGHSSEIIFDGVYPDDVPASGSSWHRGIVAHFMSELAKGVK
jgi:hypothetical protein